MRIPEPTLVRRVVFGLIMLGALSALGRWLSTSSGNELIFPVLASLGALVLLLTPVTPISSALYRGWMRFGLLLSRITTPPVMFVLYVVVITPVALMSRLIGRDPLRRVKPPTWGDPRVSEWEARPSTSDPASHLRQY